VAVGQIGVQVTTLEDLQPGRHAGRQGDTGGVAESHDPTHRAGAGSCPGRSWRWRPGPPIRSTGTRAGEVGFRHKYGEGRRPLPQSGPFAVVVRLQRLPAGWWVLGVNGRSIQITSPTRLQQISSPLTVRGTAEVYEGTLYFKVTQDRSGRDLLLGQGFVDGRASTQPGDLGTLRFRQPASTGPGWVTVYDASADGSNAIIQATMVRVHAHPDRPYTKLLGEDRDPSDGFHLVWRYPNDPILAHLGIEAVGPGGTGGELLYIVHPQPRPLGTRPAPHHRGAGRLQWTHPGSLTPQPVRCPPGHAGHGGFEPLTLACHRAIPAVTPTTNPRVAGRCTRAGRAAPDGSYGFS
jgi:hypothetical protein